MVELLRTGNRVRLGYLQNLLTENGIESVVFDTAAGNLWPGAIPHRLMIDDRDLWRAGHVLREVGEEGDS